MKVIYQALQIVKDDINLMRQAQIDMAGKTNAVEELPHKVRLITHDNSSTTQPSDVDIAVVPVNNNRSLLFDDSLMELDNSKELTRDGLRTADSVTALKAIYYNQVISNIEEWNAAKSKKCYGMFASKITNEIPMIEYLNITLNNDYSVDPYVFDIVTDYNNNSTLNPGHANDCFGIKRVTIHTTGGSSNLRITSASSPLTISTLRNSANTENVINIKNDTTYMIPASKYDGYAMPLYFKFTSKSYTNYMTHISYKQPTSTSGTTYNTCTLNLKTGIDTGNSYLTRTTGTVGANKAITVPANKLLFAITKGGSAFHIYGCYNSTSSSKSVNIKLPSSSNVLYYTTYIAYVNNTSQSDREILYLCTNGNKYMTSISMDAYANATDLTSLYLYTDVFSLSSTSDLTF